MTDSLSSSLWKLGVVGTLTVGTAIAPIINVSAQIIPDNTLGSESSTVIPNQILRGIPGDRIEGGALRGSNLFHSFSEFNINERRAAYFSNPSGVQTILTRVTGNNLSAILGRLGVLGNASLFFLNPNGIIFGANASLDIRGTFLATTASSFKFVDGSEFSATSPQAPPLLTINVVPGLQMGKPVGAINNTGTLAVDPGQSLTLYGNTVTNTGSLIATGGTVQVLGNQISLLSPTQIDVSSFTGGGTILIGGDYQGSGDIPTASNTFVEEGAILNASALFPSSQSLVSTPSINGGKIIVWAEKSTFFAGTINAQGASPTPNSPFPTFSSNGGSVEVSGKENLFFQGIVNTTAPLGNTGTLLLDPTNITIVAGATPNPTNAADGVWSFAENPGNQTIGSAAIATLLNTTSLTLEATNTIDVNSSVNGNSTNSLTLRASTIRLNSASLRQNGGGNIVLDTTQNAGTAAATTAGTAVLMNNGGLSTAVLAGATHDGGNITVITGTFFAVNSAQLNTSTNGQGDAGSVKLIVSGAATFDGIDNLGFRSGIFTQINSTGIGKSGGIEITAGSLAITNEARLSATTFGRGDAGNVKITVSETATFGKNVDVLSQVGATGIGNSGGIALTAGSLVVTNGARFSASTSGRGDAGSVKLTVSGSAIFDGGDVASQVNSTGIGKSGGIEIIAGSLAVLNGSQLSATTLGRGDAGSVKLTVSGAAIFDGMDSLGFRSGVFSQVNSTGIGKSGGIEITAGSLGLTGGALLSGVANGRGDAGRVKLNVSGAAILDQGDVFSQVVNGVGNAGGVEIAASSLAVLNGSQLSASTKGQGNAGNVKLNISGAAVFDASFVFSQVGTNASGNAGGIDITATSLMVAHGSSLSSSTLGKGGAGSVVIRAQDIVFQQNGQIASSVEATGKGNSGNVAIAANSLLMTEGSQITTSTRGLGNAGSVVITANDKIALQSSSLILSSAEPGAVGKGGDITLTSAEIFLADSSGITVNNNAKSNVLSGTGFAGAIALQANTLTLANKSFITAETASGSGGNIQLTVRDLLLLRQNSIISTTAGTAQAGGDGGNISIFTRFVVGVLSENSDIRANAFTGNGGRINITAQGILGLKFQSQETPRSDITASSQFGTNGQVVLNTPDLDPNRGLLSLPAVLTDSANLMTQECSSSAKGTNKMSKFTVRGRGGLPANPEDLFNGNQALVELAEEVKSQESGVRRDRADKAGRQDASPDPRSITEAQGWVMGADGAMYLVADVAMATPHSGWQPSQRCQTTNPRH